MTPVILLQTLDNHACFRLATVLSATMRELARRVIAILTTLDWYRQSNYILEHPWNDVQGVLRIQGGEA